MRQGLWVQLLHRWVLVCSFKSGAVAIWAFTFGALALNAILGCFVTKGSPIAPRFKMTAFAAPYTFFAGRLWVILIITIRHLAYFLLSNCWKEH